MGQSNAPRGSTVSKPFQGIFSDPDGDELVYTVSVPEEQRRLVDTLLVGVNNRVFFMADAEDDWKALTPPLADRPVVTVTLTATDYRGLSASASGDFVIWWDSYPEVVTATASQQAIDLTFDLAVEDEPRRQRRGSSR